MAKKTFPVFDTSVFADYSDDIGNRILTLPFPTIVFYELIATSIDESALQRYERWRSTAKQKRNVAQPDGFRLVGNLEGYPSPLFVERLAAN